MKKKDEGEIGSRKRISGKYGMGWEFAETRATAVLLSFSSWTDLIPTSTKEQTKTSFLL